MSYLLRKINTQRLANYVQRTGSLSEEAILHLLDTIRIQDKQLVHLSKVILEAHKQMYGSKARYEGRLEYICNCPAC